MAKRSGLRKSNLIPEIRQMTNDFIRKPSRHKAELLHNFLQGEENHLEGENAFNSTIFNADIVLQGKTYQLTHLRGDLGDELRKVSEEWS